MSTAVPTPASDHWAKIASASVWAGSAIRASGTIAPANRSCGITASGIKLIAWSWVVTSDETSRPMPTAAKPGDDQQPEDRRVGVERASRAAGRRAARPRRAASAPRRARTARRASTPGRRRAAFRPPSRARTTARSLTISRRGVDRAEPDHGDHHQEEQLHRVAGVAARAVEDARSGTARRRTAPASAPGRAAAAGCAGRAEAACR